MQGYASTFVSISNSTFAVNSAQRGNDTDTAIGSSTFNSLQGLGGAMRLFVAALWLDSTAVQDNFAPAAGGGVERMHPGTPSSLACFHDKLSAVGWPLCACILLATNKK